MVEKINVALIGSGNIGTDLVIKALRSQNINPVWMVGIDEDSDGLSKARAAGLKTTALGIDGLLPFIQEDNIKIAFDATSAYVHAENNKKLALTRYIANRALVVYESSVLFTNSAKSLIWLLRMNKLKTKYNALAQCKLESLSLSTALLAIY